VSALPRIEVMVFDGCPNAERALEIARRVADGLVPGAAVERVGIDTPEKAAALGFLGSPSIRVNGVDAEGKRVAEGMIGCRIYEGGDGVPPEWMVEAAILRAMRPRDLLFLCVANSARSQMAEGIARSLAPAGVRVSSAGSEPAAVKSEAIVVLREIGIDISHHQSKSVASLPSADTVDAVITLCAEEVCPLFLRRVRQVHWAFPDPAAAPGGAQERLAAFREVRDELRRRLSLLFAVGAPEGEHP
jgi:arsenate reductase